MSVRVFAPAKINLTLEVGRPRADGYHPLQSAVVFADVGDWIEAAPNAALTLAVTGPFAEGLSVGGDNLVIRAARLLDPGRGAALKLEKNLPIASGIGGGSSDAAATLIALNQMWSLQKGAGELACLSAELGADVAVCVRQQSAWMTGVGERIAAMDAPELHAVLINPGKPLATPPVYRRFDDMGLGDAFAEHAQPRWPTRETAIHDIQRVGNDLEAPAVALMPEIGDLLALLRADLRVQLASLSGSGATCFAITESAQTAHALASELCARNRDWWVQATTLGGA